MRKWSLIRNKVYIDPGGGFIAKKVMLYETDERDTYVFLYDSVEDKSCSADLWCKYLESAEKLCAEEYGIRAEDWIMIDDPLPFCQHDIIEPIRVKNRETGKPQWGVFEKLVDGEWVEVK